MIAMSQGNNHSHENEVEHFGLSSFIHPTNTKLCEIIRLENIDFTNAAAFILFSWCCYN